MKSIQIDYFKYKKDLRLKTIEDKTFVFDPIRKKNIRLLPEELVRQLCILYLLNEKGYSNSLIKVEKSIKYKNSFRRYDILAVTNNNEPFLLVECKAPNIKLNQSTLDQIAHYNLRLKVPYLFITNGKSNYCFTLADGGQEYLLVSDIPTFKK